MCFFNLFTRTRLAMLAIAFVLFFVMPSAQAFIDVNLQMQLGNPSNATANTNNYTHYLMQRTVEALDYNATLGEPNWTSWDLTTNDLGTASRSGSFFTDTNLPANFYRVKDSDYTHSGYNRGHMCPSADRTDTTNDNRLVFFMSDIIPQTPDNNQGPWANLESYCRVLAQANELLIICGPNGFSGALINTNGPVAIPNYVWKIVVVVPLGSGTALSRITADTRVIAVNMPNIQGIRSVTWTNYLTSVNVLQANTGDTFFTALTDNVATVLRAKVDGIATPPTLNLTWSSGKIIITWPTAATGFLLEQNANLTTTNWVAYGGIVSSNSTTMTVTNSVSASSMFYRLRHP